MDSADKHTSNRDDYGTELDDGVVGLVPYGFNSDSDNSYELPSTSKRRKKRVRVEDSTWFAARNRKHREEGKRYLGKQKVDSSWNYKIIKESWTLKERCNCQKKSPCNVR